MKEKLVWVEWMKFLAMFFVVWGHCFPETMSDFVYAFNVPVFFVIAGFLAHKAESNKVFYRKLLKTLLAPYLLLGYIKGFGAICKGGGGNRACHFGWFSFDR